MIQNILNEYSNNTMALKFNFIFILIIIIVLAKQEIKIEILKYFNILPWIVENYLVFIKL